MAITKLNTGQQLLINSDLDFNSIYKVKNLVDPTNPQDAATKSYVDAVKTGFDPKDSSRVATTANLSITYTATAGSSGRGQITAAPNTLDGVTLAAGNRILVKDQTTGAQNGIYVISTLGTGANGVWDRATDFDQDAEVTSGAHTFVSEGTVNSSSGWVLATVDPIIIGGSSGTSLSWVQFSGAGQITAGAGLTKTGNTIDVNTVSSARIIVNADNIDLATTSVSSGTYGNTGFNVPQYTVDAYGRLTNATNRDMFGSANTANTVFAAPNGSSGAPSFRALVAADIPNIDASKITTGTLAVARGGTNIGSYTTGDILYASGATTLSALNDVATGNALISGGVGTAPSWGKVGLTTHVSGILPVANGGTGLNSSTATNGQLLIGNGSGLSLATLTQGSNISITNGSGSITIAVTGVLTSANWVPNETPSGTIDGSNTAFTLANTPATAVQLTYNGSTLKPGAGNDYTISGTAITMLFAPLAGSNLLAFYFK
jgi:hypothetical protein